MRTGVVLLVDDEENLLQGLERMLRREPFDVLTALGAGPAFAILDQRPVDVVVSDERMPGMSGTRFLAEVCRRRPETVRIMLTGLASLDTALHAINHGEVFRFLTKPCDAGDLIAAIRQALIHRELLVQGRRLLTTVRRQSAVIEELETQHPGIARLDQNEDGAILVDEEDAADVEAFLREASAEIDRASSRFQPA